MTQDLLRFIEVTQAVKCRLVYSSQFTPIISGDATAFQN
jgi:hypothetical protein